MGASQTEGVDVMDWTEERTALASKLWVEDGLSAGEIAARLGDGATRNAVLGKLHRMKLGGADNPNAGKVKAGQRSGRVGQRGNPGQAKAAVIRKRVEARVKLNQQLSAPRSGSANRFGDPGMKFGANPDTGGSLEADTAPLRGDAWAALPGVTPVSLLARKVGSECCWPIGDPLEPGFAVCGAATRDGASYCPTHARRARGSAAPAARVKHAATAVSRVF